MKRLCIVTHRCRRHDGQGRVNLEIAKAALTAGWDVTVVATEFEDGVPATWIKIPPSKLPSNLLKYQDFAWRTANFLRAAAAEFDIIHVNGFITWHKSHVNTAHFVHAGWLKSNDYPYQWFSSPYEFYQCLFTALNAKLERYAFTRSGAIVGVSAKIRSELEVIGLSSKKISVICNGVDIVEFQPGPPERVRFGLPADVPLFLFAGDIKTSRKNLETVLRAMVAARHCRLAVAGRLAGSPYPALAKSLGVADRVVFLDMVRDMPKLMRSVDVFVFPSRYEAMSLVLLEAMASGLPVITAVTAGGADIVGDGGRVLADPNDAETLAAWMEEFARQPQLRSLTGQNARKIAERYSWEVMGRTYLGLYETLCQARA